MTRRSASFNFVVVSRLIRGACSVMQTDREAQPIRSHC
jgi:hypothetical protein